MIDRNFMQKVQKIFLNTMQKSSPENSIPLPRNRKKTHLWRQ